jgi:hypothetical protein
MVSGLMRSSFYLRRRTSLLSNSGWENSIESRSKSVKILIAFVVIVKRISSKESYNKTHQQIKTNQITIKFHGARAPIKIIKLFLLSSTSSKLSPVSKTNIGWTRGWTSLLDYHRLDSMLIFPYWLILIRLLFSFGYKLLY